MHLTEIEKGKLYKAKVVGFSIIREIRVNTVLTNVVTAQDIESKINVVARICDLVPT